MTEKDRMIEIIAPHVSAWGDDEAIAEALIEAGFGDVTKFILEIELLQRDIDNLVRTLKEGAEEVEEAEQRAQVAERALLTACVNLIKDEKDNVNMELLARVVYTNYLRKAKKELTEEKKDD